MKYIKRFILLSFILCMLFTVNTFAANAVTGDTLVTCNADGTLTGKGTTINGAAITVSPDTSGNYVYSGIILGVFKKGTDGWSLVPELEQSIATNSTTINVTSFGDITKYEYDSVYALGYRILYESTGDEQIVGGTSWVPINGNFFKVQSGAGSAAITSVSISASGTNDVAVSGTGTNVKAAKYRIYYTTSDTLPSLDRTPNASSPGSGWTDSNIVKDMTITGGTDVSATALGSDFDSSWKYVLFKVAVTSDSASTDGWVWKYTDAYKIATQEVIVPPQPPAGSASISSITITPPSIPAGQTGYNKPVGLSAAGTNVTYAKYRIYYSTSDTAPTVTSVQDAENPGSGWTDSGIIQDMTVNSTTSASATVPGTSFSDTSWKYTIFKTAVSSDGMSWTWKYSSLYKIQTGELITPTYTDDTTGGSSSGSDGGNTNYIPTPMMTYGEVTVASGYLNYIGHNQAITIGAGPEEIIVTAPDSPNTKYGPYTSQDMYNLKGSNKFIDGSYMKYRLEFDALNSANVNKIRDMLIFLNLNTTAEENITLNVVAAQFVKRNNDGSVSVLKNLACTKEAGNRFTIALGDDDSGVPMLTSNGPGRYAVVYTVYMNVGSDSDGSTLSKIRNEAQIIMNIGDSLTRTVEFPKASHKYYIETKIWRGKVVYR